MITRLYIRNYALIDTLEVDFGAGFSVVTGETGAGKSIILGALGLLLGGRADQKSIRQGADRCVVEAEFNNGDTILRREILASGKSRAFIDDSPVPLSEMKEAGSQLVDIHSQHQNLLLSKQNFALGVVDTIGSASALLAEYKESFAEYQAVAAELAALKAELEQGQLEADFIRFQYDELTSANLVAGEQEQLEQLSEAMAHSEEIKQSLYSVDDALSAEQTGIVEQLRRAQHALSGIVKVFPQVEELVGRMDSCTVELKDIMGEVASLLDGVDFDPAEQQKTDNRLDLLYSLQKKYRMQTVEELIAKRDELGSRLTRIDTSDETIAELSRREQQLQAKCQKLADKLSAMRSKAARSVEEQCISRLVLLGMPKAKFSVSVEKGALSATGQDNVSFLFSANADGRLMPVEQVASGGETARLMLALKAVVGSHTQLPTIIFDEIDTGVSGRVAEQMGDMMADMGQGSTQVISITHLPQIAAKGTNHYKVYKKETDGKTSTYMQHLTDDERIGEIAQMLSGSEVTPEAIANAGKLLGSPK